MLRTAGAFANPRGGLVMMGVSPDSEVVGLDVVEETLKGTHYVTKGS